MRSLLLIVVIAIAGCAHHSRATQSSPTHPLLTPYQCESGRTIWASYPTYSTAVVTYRGQTLRMRIAVSASGARYVGGGLEWWTKGHWSGYEGTLFRHRSDGRTGEILEQCQQRRDPNALESVLRLQGSLGWGGDMTQPDRQGLPAARSCLAGVAPYIPSRVSWTRRSVAGAVGSQVAQVAQVANRL